MKYPTDTIPAHRVRLLDADGELLRLISAEEASEIIQSKRVSIHGTKTRIRSLRYLSADRSMVNRACKLRYEKLGEPHRHESDTNPRGVWTFDRLRDPALFTSVVRGILRS